MAKRTQIVCLHEGKQGRSIDPVFINALVKALKPAWIRPFGGSNLVRLIPCGGRGELIQRVPAELRACIRAGADTTLVVFADVDHDKAVGGSMRESSERSALAPVARLVVPELAKTCRENELMGNRAVSGLKLRGQPYLTVI